MLEKTNQIPSLLNDAWSKLFRIEDHAYERYDKNNIHCFDYGGKDLNGPICKLLLLNKLQNLSRNLPFCVRHYAFSVHGLWQSP